MPWSNGKYRSFIVSQHLGQSQHLDTAQRIIGDLVKSAQADQWYSGISQTAQVPTLTIGLAGIEYQLLRTIDPYRIPSVLTLELPHQTQV